MKAYTSGWNKNKAKTFRIREVYKITFDACMQVYGNNRNELFQTLLKLGKDIDVEKITALPTYQSFEFLEKILNELCNTNMPMNQFRHSLDESNIQSVINYYNKQLNRLESVPVAFKLYPEYIEFIQEYAEKRIGEPIELAVANFISKLNEFEYGLIETVVRNLIDQKLKESFNLDFPFNTHTIYLKLPEEEFYKLESDLSKIPVDSIKKHSPKHPSIVLNKSAFDENKDMLLNKKNLNKLDIDTAKGYHKIGFISEEELNNFLD